MGYSHPMILNFFTRYLYYTMDAKLAKTYYSPGGYWKGFAAIKKSYPKLPRYQKKPQKSGCSSKHSGTSFSPHRSAFQGRDSTCLHQTKCTRRIFFFLPHDKLPRGRKVFKYALTVVDVASRYKEAEPLTSKNSDEVALAFKRIYKRSPLKWPELLQVDPGREFMGAVTKEIENHKTYIRRGRVDITVTRPFLNVLTAPWLSACSGTSTPLKCACLRASGPRRG